MNKDIQPWSAAPVWLRLAFRTFYLNNPARSAMCVAGFTGTHATGSVHFTMGALRFTFKTTRKAAGF